MRARQERLGSPEHSACLDGDALPMPRTCLSYKEKATAGRRWRGLDLNAAREEVRPFSVRTISGRSKGATTGSYRNANYCNAQFTHRTGSGVTWAGRHDGICQERGIRTGSAEAEQLAAPAKNLFGMCILEEDALYKNLPWAANHCGLKEGMVGNPGGNDRWTTSLVFAIKMTISLTSLPPSPKSMA